MQVSDLSMHQDLVICCGSPLGCTTQRCFTRSEAIERFGADFPLDRIRRNARCGVCGFLGAATIVQYIGPTGMDG